MKPLTYADSHTALRKIEEVIEILNNSEDKEKTDKITGTLLGLEIAICNVYTAQTGKHL